MTDALTGWPSYQDGLQRAERILISVPKRQTTDVQRGSPREGARSEAEQRLAAGGRRLPRPVARQYPAAGRLP